MDSKTEKRKSILKKGVGFAVAYVVIKWLIIGTVGTLLYRSGHWNNWYLLAIPVIGLTMFGIRKYKKKKSEK
jgi:hypothetical protein